MAALGACLAVVFYLSSFMGRKPRLTNPPPGPTCASEGDSTCGAWEAPSAVLEWSPIVVVQALVAVWLMLLGLTILADHGVFLRHWSV